MKNAITAFLICVGLILIGAIAALQWHNAVPSASVGSDIGVSGYTAASTSTGITVSGSSTFVLGTSTARAYTLLGNASTTGAVFCNLDNGKPASASTGVFIAPNGVYRISPDDNNIYRGAINCITTGGNATVTAYGR